MPGVLHIHIHNAEWTSIVAHDLRQPLNNFSLWLGVLERQAHRAGADLTDGLNHARASIKQLDRMISGLLDASPTWWPARPGTARQGRLSPSTWPAEAPRCGCRW